MRDWLIADLHLSASAPELNQLFFNWLSSGSLQSGDRLWILGDLFDMWVGDDQLDHDAHAQQVAQALSGLGDRAIECAFLHGNRDFLIRSRFAEMARTRILPEQCMAKIGIYDTILLHGDSLCTDDLPYMAMRSQIRQASWQDHVLTMSYIDRLALGQQARQREYTPTRPEDPVNDVFDATEHGVCQSLALCPTGGIHLMIHGHTHRPARHSLPDNVGQRWVIPDWRVLDNGLVMAGAICVEHEHIGFVQLGDTLQAQLVDHLF